MFELTYNRLAQGVNEGWKQGKSIDDVKLMLELKTNVAVFSAFKSHTQGAEYVNLLVDENGEKRSWSDFRKLAIEIDREYNRNWLATEYNMAIRQARAAEQWTKFVEEKKVYPNLEYMPSQSADPSDDHMKYYGIIKPINDPFWDTALPPSRWGCKCWVKQTKAEATDQEIDAPAPLPGIEGNPGKSGRVFSATSPFVTEKSKKDRQMIQENLKKLRNPLNDQVEMKLGKQTISVHVNADPKDVTENINFIAPAAVKFKKNYQIREHLYDGRKNPEYGEGEMVGDLASWKKAESADNFIDSAWKQKYQKQMKQFEQVFIALDFNGKLNLKTIDKALFSIKGKMNVSSRCKYVIIKNGENYVMIENGDLMNPKKFDKTRKELLKK